MKRLLALSILVHRGKTSHVAVTQPYNQPLAWTQQTFVVPGHLLVHALWNKMP